MNTETDSFSFDDQPFIAIQERGETKQAECIQKEARRNGWRLFNIEASYNILPRGVKPVGALLYGGLKDPAVKLMQELNIPYVRVGSHPYYYAEGVSSVFIDTRECGHVAASFYADRGFSSLAFVGNDPWSDGKDIYNTYAETAEKMGCQCQLFRFKSKLEWPESSSKAVRMQKQAVYLEEWLESMPKPIGLFTVSDRMAMRICSYVIDAGLRVPEDVAILSAGDNSFLCETGLVPISSIKRPWEAMWETAFGYLKGMINGEREAMEHIYIPPTGVAERQSTKVIAVSDPLVAKGLRFIWDHYDRDISVQDLIVATGMSRTTIQRGFKRSLNRGFNEELRRKRLEVAERLLLHSTLTVAEVGVKVGFNSRNYFHKAFVKAFGTTPSAYRKER